MNASTRRLIQRMTPEEREQFREQGERRILDRIFDGDEVDAIIANPLRSVFVKLAKEILDRELMEAD